MLNVPTFGAEDVRALLDYPGCIAAVRAAMAGFSGAGIAQPLRSIHRVRPHGALGVMPGSLPAPGGVGAKLITVYHDAARKGRSAHRGIVVLFSQDDGELLCIADAGEITRIRTAAASAVATDVLARQDARRLAIFGCGTQAESHVHALKYVRPFEEVLVWGRDFDTASEFARRLSREAGLAVRAVREPQAAARVADVICTVTGSPAPVLKKEWVTPGTHVNAVGSSYAGPTEVDSALVVGSRYIADSRASALAAAAEFLIARDAGLIGDEHIAAEIGEVILGRVPGRTSREQLTLYKSLGHVVQDLAAITYIYERAGRNRGESPS